MSLKKLKFIDVGILRLIWNRSKFKLKKRLKKIDKVRVWSRKSSIPLSLIGKKLKIHKGNIFVSKRITKLSTFRKIGEFSFTKKPFYYSLFKK